MSAVWLGNSAAVTSDLFRDTASPSPVLSHRRILRDAHLAIAQWRNNCMTVRWIVCFVSTLGQRATLTREMPFSPPPIVLRCNYIAQRCNRAVYTITRVQPCACTSRGREGNEFFSTSATRHSSGGIVSGWSSSRRGTTAEVFVWERRTFSERVRERHGKNAVLAIKASDTCSRRRRRCGRLADVVTTMYTCMYLHTRGTFASLVAAKWRPTSTKRVLVIRTSSVPID